MTGIEDFRTKLESAAKIILVVGGFLSVVVLSYFLYYYGWTGERQFTSPLGVVLYYVVPAGAASLLFASVGLKQTYKINLAILCISLVVSMYGAELFLRFTHSRLSGPKKPIMFYVRDSEEKQREATNLAKQFGVEVDTRNWVEVVDELRTQGVDAVPFISPPNNLFIKQPDGELKSAINIRGEEVIPLGAVSNKITVLCNENGQWATYLSDERGFNNPSEIWHSNHVKIAALGDSFAQGYCVPTEQSFVGLIRQRVPAILNLGIAGNGPLLMLATIKEYLPVFKPEVVLWFYFEGNDLLNLHDERKSRILMRYLKGDFNQGLLTRQDDIDQTLTNEIASQTALEQERRAHRLANRRTIVPILVEISKLVALRQALALAQGTEDRELELVSEVDGPGIELLRDILSQAQACVSTWGGTLYFVYLPAWTRYFDIPEIGIKQRPQILNLVSGLGIPIIDIHPVFQAQDDVRSLFPFREPGHYNDKGHQLVADEVLKVISSSVSDDSRTRSCTAAPPSASPNSTGAK